METLRVKCQALQRAVYLGREQDGGSAANFRPWRHWQHVHRIGERRSRTQWLAPPLIGYPLQLQQTGGGDRARVVSTLEQHSGDGSGSDIGKLAEHVPDRLRQGLGERCLADAYLQWRIRAAPDRYGLKGWRLAQHALERLEMARRKLRMAEEIHAGGVVPLVAYRHDRVVAAIDGNGFTGFRFVLPAPVYPVFIGRRLWPF